MAPENMSNNNEPKKAVFDKDAQRRFLDIYVKDEYKRITGASFGQYSTRAKERRRILGFFKKCKIVDSWEMKRFFDLIIVEWSQWHAAGRSNFVGYIFNEGRFMMWRSKQQPTVAGKVSTWEEF